MQCFKMPGCYILFLSFLTGGWHVALTMCVLFSPQLNVSYPATGCQKLFEFDDEKKVRIFNEKRMGQEVEADTLGDEWKGYVLRITGGNDKQGFPMKQGVLTNSKSQNMVHSSSIASSHTLK